MNERRTSKRSWQLLRTYLTCVKRKVARSGATSKTNQLRIGGTVRKNPTLRKNIRVQLAGAYRDGEGLSLLLGGGWGGGGGVGGGVVGGGGVWGGRSSKKGRYRGSSKGFFLLPPPEGLATILKASSRMGQRGREELDGLRGLIRKIQPVGPPNRVVVARQGGCRAGKERELEERRSCTGNINR